MKHKKSVLWGIAAAVAAVCIFLLICFFMNRNNEENDLSFLNYKNLVSIAAQVDTCPADVICASGVQKGVIEGKSLSVYLDGSAWKADSGIFRSVRRDTEKNSAANIKIQFNDDIFLWIFDTDTARVYSEALGSDRYYRTCKGDYKKALALIKSDSPEGPDGARKTDGKDKDKEEEPLEIIPPKIKELTAAQIDEVNKAFDPLILDENGNIKAANPINSFFTSFYDSPEDIDIYAFLQYFPKDGDVTDEAEFSALKNSANYPFDAKDTLGSVPCPIHKYSSETVDKALRKYAGITISELKGVGMDRICHLAETDTYYTFTSDFGPGIFLCAHGEIEGDTVRLYSDPESDAPSVLTLKKKDGRYLITSHQPLEAP